VRPERFADPCGQAWLPFISHSEPEQAHTASARGYRLSKVGTAHMREAMVGYLRHLDTGRARWLASGLGLGKLPDAPPTAVWPEDRPASPALQLIGKMNATLEGRRVALLVEDGSDGVHVQRLRQAVTQVGAVLKIVAPKLGGVRLADGSHLSANGQLSGTPPVMFDAVAVVLSDAGAQNLLREAAAIDFVRDAFGHLKALGIDAGGQRLAQAAGVEPAEGVIAITEIKRFISAARLRQWGREAKVRRLA
jgi:catalase